jgi:phosphatidylglycerol---prolipoprotein diacylglyceryl transferase
MRTPAASSTEVTAAKAATAPSRVATATVLRKRRSGSKRENRKGCCQEDQILRRRRARHEAPRKPPVRGRPCGNAILLHWTQGCTKRLQKAPKVPPSRIDCRRQERSLPVRQAGFGYAAGRPQQVGTKIKARRYDQNDARRQRQKNDGGMPALPLYWREMIPFIHLGRLLVPTFGLMVAAAMVAAYYVLRADMARRGLAAKNSTTAEMFVAVPALCGIVGAKLYHVLETPRELLADPLGQLFSRYGLAWFGGLIAGLAAFVWLARRFRFPLLEIFDAGSPAAAIGYGVGRIGCLLSGDGDYGKPTSLPWGMSFPNGLVPTTERVHPTPIYELIAACAIAWILWKMGARQLLARAEHGDAAMRSGTVFGAYLILTGVARFLVEFIRINPRSVFGVLTNAQAASAVCVFAGVALWSWARTRALPQNH